MGHRNIEIKARCADPAAIRAVLHANRAEFRGPDVQTDTYFRVRHGRLKLREGQVENCLIYYDREDQAGPKRSDVVLFPTAANSPLKEVLSKALGVLVVVEKRREIYFIGNVKFHLDTVKGLGNFVEIEATDLDGLIGNERLLAQCQFFLGRCNIHPADLVSVSYCDLLLHQSKG